MSGGLRAPAAPVWLHPLLMLGLVLLGSGVAACNHDKGAEHAGEEPDGSEPDGAEPDDAEHVGSEPETSSPPDEEPGEWESETSSPPDGGPRYPSPDNSAPELPLFPWPPPTPSARVRLPSAWFDGDGGEGSTLGAVADRLEAAVQGAGHPLLSYFAAPGGFALVTTLEQIDAEGRPVAGPQRFSEKPPALGAFDLGGYVKRLLRGADGTFRLVVLAVTDESFGGGEESMSMPLARDLLRTGLSDLPADVRSEALTAQHVCWALVYQFYKPSKDSDPRLVDPSAFPALEHLDRGLVLAHLRR